MTRRLLIVAAGGFALVVAPLAAQNAVVVDLSEKPAPFSEADYSALLSCTLEKHPDDTRRYAQYHLFRRNSQTWQQNEADPDSGLMMPIIEDCHEIELGKQFPFSLDRLIADWGKSHDLAEGQETPKEESLAACMWEKAPEHARTAMETEDQMKFFMAMVKGGKACGFTSAIVEINTMRSELREARPMNSKD